MSQHVSGHLGQSLSHDYGEFITVAKGRYRKSLILAYTLGGPVNDPPEKQIGDVFSVNLMMGGHWISTSPLRSREECEKQLEQLDWIFHKDDHKDG